MGKTDNHYNLYMLEETFRKLVVLKEKLREKYKEEKGFSRTPREIYNRIISKGISSVAHAEGIILNEEIIKNEYDNYLRGKHYKRNEKK